MTTGAAVPALRPNFDTGGILSGDPVSAADWGAMAGLANFCNGHGGMLIPWCAIGRTVASAATETFHFYVAPKNRAVQRIWCVNMRGSAAGTSAQVTPGGGSASTVFLGTVRSTRAAAFFFSEPLSAKTNTAADTSISIKAISGNVVVESIAMYEQTRLNLAQDTTDYGVDLASVRMRQPIADYANKSVAGVIDAYKNLDARRAGLFHWSTPDAQAVQFTGGSYQTLFPLSPPALAAISTTGSTTGTITVAARAKVDAGTGQVRFTAAGAGGNVVLSITSTSFAWVSNTLSIDCENLSVSDGRRSSRWEGLTIEGNDNTATTLSVSAISVYRATAPL